MGTALGRSLLPVPLDTVTKVGVLETLVDRFEELGDSEFDLLSVDKI